MNGDIQVISILIFLLTMVVSVIMTQFVRRRRDVFTLRDIPAYRVLPMIVGQAIEANRPMHVSLGGAGIGGKNTLLALASAELAYQTVQRAAIGATPPILTVGDSSALPLAQDTLRRAYASRDLLERYHAGSVRWYPQGLALAAGLTSLVGNDRVAGNVLVGSFGAELALVSDALYRRNQPLIASSDQLEGQAVAFVMSDQPLIGEEIFTAGAYLGETASQIAGVVTQDVLRWLLIIAIFIPTELAVARQIGMNQDSVALLIIVEIFILAMVLIVRSVRGLRRR